MYEWIASPVDYGPIRLKNRIIFAPTTMGLSRDETFKRIRKIARGGCAMIILGDIPVVPFGKEPSLYAPDGLRYYQQLVEIIHTQGCNACAQLYLTDSFRHPAEGETELKRLEVKDLKDYIPTLSEERLFGYVEDFAEAVCRCLSVGFDIIQILGDRMLGSFSSPIFNRRQDRYGGVLENRLRLTTESVRGIRRRFPKLGIDFKLPMRQENPHYGNTGILVEELPEAVALLEQAGVTSFHVALADHGGLDDVIPSAKHAYFGEEGCFLRYCDEVKKYTSLPVCGVGGLTDPDFIEKQLGSSRIDCFAMSRQLIADPEWGNKVLAGKPETIDKCLRCNGRCIRGMMEHTGVYCFREC